MCSSPCSISVSPSSTHVVTAAAAAGMHASGATFIDARSPSLHAIERVQEAVCFTSLAGKTAVLPSHARTVVVYDSGSTSFSQGFSRAGAAITALNAARPLDTRFYLLSGGLPAVRADVPALLDTSLSASPETLLAIRRKLARQSRPAWAADALDDLASSAAPAAQILPWLYLGSAADACKLARLRRFGVTHIVCVAKELKPMFPDKYEYTHVLAEDKAEYNLRSSMHELCNVLAGVRKRYERGERVCVLVHCAAGLSRSASITLSYLVRDCGFDVAGALAYVRKRRAGADPVRFMEQLKAWETEVRPVKNIAKLVL